MNLTKIKPKTKNESDKYSWNLYKYLSKKGTGVKVYYRKVSSKTEKAHTYNKNNFSMTDAIIGFPSENSIMGVKLIEVLRKIPSLDYWYQRALKEYVEITDEFFMDYEDIGRCLFDRDHNVWMMYTEERFTYKSDNERKCNWCGINHKRVTEEVVTKVEKWI